MTQPSFLGLGGQKCASSWIHKVLEDHPDVVVSQPKELDFFTHYFNRGYSWYEQHFEGADQAGAVGEVSPSYFCDPLAPARVRDYRPDMKLVLALRDPVRRAFSNHLHEIRKGFYRGPDPTFETALGMNPMYVFQSRYGTHLEAWRHAFPEEQILLLVQEEIETDPDAAATRLYRFLGVDPGHRSDFLHKRSNESVGPRNRSLFRAWRAVGDAGRRYGLGGVVAAIKRFPPVAAAMRANLSDLRVEIPPMRPETARRLEAELAPELLKLAEITGRRDWPWPSWRAATSARATSDDLVDVAG